MSRRASKARWALSSWEREIQAFTRTMTRIITASSQSSPPLAQKDSPAAARRTRIMGSFSWPRNRRKGPGRGAPSRRLGPYRSSLRRASAPVRPRRASVSSRRTVSAAAAAYHSRMACLPFNNQIFPAQYITEPVQF